MTKPRVFQDHPRISGNSPKMPNQWSKHDNKPIRHFPVPSPQSISYYYRWRIPSFFARFYISQVVRRIFVHSHYCCVSPRIHPNLHWAHCTWKKKINSQRFRFQVRFGLCPMWSVFGCPCVSPWESLDPPIEGFRLTGVSSKMCNQGRYTWGSSTHDAIVGNWVGY